MAYKRIKLTEDHLKLIENINFETFVFDNDSKCERFGWGIDQYSLFGGTYAMEDIALILGRYNEYIKGTEEDTNGKQYPKELEDYMWSLYDDIYKNMNYIINLVLYFSNKGGLTSGTYKYDSNNKNWTKE